MRLIRPISIVFGACALACVPVTASASPEFSIGFGTDVSWTQALAGIPQGRVRPVLASEGLTSVASEFYAGLGSHVLRTTTLVPDVLYEGQSSLVMAWDPPLTTDLAIGAWQFDYSQDPNLTGRRVIVKVTPPEAVSSVSVELIDVRGFSRGWFQNRPATGWGGQREYNLSPTGGAQGLNYGSHEFFDVTQVASIRVDESGSTQTFPLPPGGIPNGRQWNVWGTVTVIPSPASFALLSLGVGLTLRRRHN